MERSERSQPSASAAQPTQLRTTHPRAWGRRLASAIRRLRHDGPFDLALHAAALVRRRNQLRKYRFNVRRLLRTPDELPIDRPLFVLGVPGGGGTLLARTLYRHPQVVYASGNSRYWAGDDEIHNCPHLRGLPEALILRSAHFYNLDDSVEHHPVFGRQRSPFYATDELLPRYQRGAGDADPETAAAFRRVIQRILQAYAHDPARARFVDMSQLYTVQVRFVAELLKGTDPRFVLLTRNPYSWCRSATAKMFDGLGAAVSMPRPERLRLTAEIWHNSYRLAHACAGEVPMLQLRYEDFVTDPETSVRRIDAFAGLEFQPRQLPAAGDRLPLGSNSPWKWYPVRPAADGDDLGPGDADLVEAVNARAAALMVELGYRVR